jgi:branched-chain amino acid transport system permease protein
MSAYAASVLSLAGIWAILALSLNLVTGYGGQVSLAQAALFGIGAYTAAIASTRYGIGFPVDLALSLVATAAVGAVLGLPALRVRHDFLVLATLGFNFVVVAIFQYGDFFGGSQGILGIPLLQLGDQIMTPQQVLILVWALVALTLATQWYLLRSWFGLRLVAIRDDEAAAAAAGISVASTKIWAFVLCGAYAGIAGALYAHFIGSVFPGSFAFTESITILAMVILGGEGTLVGPLVAAVVLRSLPEQLRFVADWRLVLYGTLLALAIRYQPSGLLGHGSALRSWTEPLVARVRGRRRPVAQEARR